MPWSSIQNTTTTAGKTHVDVVIAVALAVTLTVAGLCRRAKDTGKKIQIQMYLPLKYLTNCNGPQKCRRCCCCWHWQSSRTARNHTLTHTCRIHACQCVCVSVSFNSTSTSISAPAELLFTLFPRISHFFGSVDYDDEGLRCAAVTGVGVGVLKYL